MSCIKKIASPIDYDCENKPIQGVESTGVLINRSDIDFSAIVRNADGTVITALPLLSGTTGYKIDNVKNLNIAGSEFVKGDVVNGHKHSFIGKFFNLNENALLNINALADDAELVLVQETKFKGSDLGSAFKIFGLDVGMKMSEGKYSSGENKGAYTFTLASEDDYEEPKAFYFLLETDYATTKARYDDSFITA